MARLNKIWGWNTISLASKFKLYKSLVTSILLYGCETWILLADSEKKDPGFRNQVHEKTSPYLLLGVQDQRLSAEQDQLPSGSTGTSSGKCQETEMHGSDMSHATTASPKPSFRAPWRAGDVVAGRGDDGWTTLKSWHLCPCQNYSQGLPAEKTKRGSLLNRTSCPPDDPVGQGTEMNWTFVDW